MSDRIPIQKSVLSRLGLFVRDNVGDPIISSPEFSGHSEKAWIDLIHPDDREHVLTISNLVMKGDLEVGRTSYRRRSSDGSWRHYRSVTVREEAEEGPRLIGVDHDVTHLHELRRDAEEARARAESIAHEAEALRVAGAVIAASLDKVEMVSRVVHQLQTLIPLETAVVFERQSRELALVSNSSEDTSYLPFLSEGFGLECLLSTLRSGMPEVFREPRNANHIWLVVPLFIRGEPEGICALRRLDGRSYTQPEIRLALAVSDYLGIALHNGRLYEGMSLLATTDQLSGLLNRHAFFLQSRNALEEAEREQAAVAVLIVDIDHFKSINDEFGHMIGDEAIRTIASVFTATLRDVDSVGRFGGEEFAAFLPGPGAAEAGRVAERVRQAVEALDISSIRRTITCSVGVCTSPWIQGITRDFDHLLTVADEALYEAKRNGRNTVVLRSTPE